MPDVFRLQKTKTSPKNKQTPTQHKNKEDIQKTKFFFGWLLHGSTGPLSGRSPFCQLQLGENVAKLLDI